MVTDKSGINFAVNKTQIEFQIDVSQIVLTRQFAITAADNEGN